MNEQSNNSTVVKKACSPEELIAAGFSFCIISGGKRADKIDNLIASIKAQNLPHYEIIIAGLLSPVVEGVKFISLPFEAQNGKTSIMRNRAMQAARYKTIVMCDDDLVLDPGFAEAISNFGREFDVLCVSMRNPDGSRLWDWATVGGPSGHRLMHYDEVDDFVYVSSGIFVISKYALETFGYFNENLAYYQAEDVEFSQRIKAAGARIEFCKDAGALHDDNRYTQFDDYPRRIYNFNKWETIAPGVEARGLYVWDGQAFPVSQEAQLKLFNSEGQDKTFCFTIAALPADSFSVPWKCIIAADGVPFAEFSQGPAASLNVKIPGGSTCLLSLKCSDVAVAFSKGAFRDQRTLGCYLLKPTFREPQVGDIVLPLAGSKLEISSLDQTGLAVFAPCMAFGNFSAKCRSLVRSFEENQTSFGLELHSVDHWFSQLCFSFASSALQWTNFLKKRKYAGTNLVCADAANIPVGFFKRARISRPGYNLNYAVTTSTDDKAVIDDLKSYDNVYVFEEADAKSLARNGIHASVIESKTFFPGGIISGDRQLPNQRQQAAAVLVDRSSIIEPALQKLTSTYASDANISIVIYVVDELPIVQAIAKRVDDHFKNNGQAERFSQTIVSAGCLEAMEELEFLRSCKERINLLTAPLSEHLEQRLR